MGKIARTYRQLQEFEAVAANYLANNGYIAENAFTKKENTKFTASLRNVMKQIGKHYESMNEEIDTIRIQHAATDEKTKVLLRDDKGGYMFTPEKLIELKAALKSFRETAVEIYERLVDADAVPSDLTEEEIEVFESIVIPTKAAV